MKGQFSINANASYTLPSDGSYWLYLLYNGSIGGDAGCVMFGNTVLSKGANFGCTISGRTLTNSGSFIIGIRYTIIKLPN